MGFRERFEKDKPMPPNFHLKRLIRYAMLPKAYGVGIFGVCFKNRYFRYPDTVLLTCADAHRNAVFDKQNRIN